MGGWPPVGFRAEAAWDHAQTGRGRRFAVFAYAGAALEDRQPKQYVGDFR